MPLVWSSRSAEKLAKKREFAPGIPERRTTSIPKIREPQAWEFSAHPHEAEKAGRHIDLRLGNPETGVAHSFVLPKAQLPQPGKMVQVIPTFDHTIQYMDYVGPIAEGYGKGVVEAGRRSRAEVYHGDPSEKAGTKVRFNLYDGPNPEEFSIRRDVKNRWFLHNKTQTRTRRADIPDFKKSYKSVPIEGIDPTNDKQVMMPKLKGAHTIIDLQAGRAPRVFSYRRAKVAPTGLIEHTHKIPQLLKQKVPKELDRTMLRGEAIAITPEGRPLPEQEISGILNAKVWRSREKQAERGVRLKIFPFDVIKYKGKNLADAPFEEKIKALEEVGSKLADLDLPEMVYTAERKLELLNKIRARKHPLTEEGVVLVEKDKSVPIKAKTHKEFDVHVRKVLRGTSKEGKPLDRATAVLYSWTSNGPIAGNLPGFKHQEGRDMLRNPDRYVGRVARARADEVSVRKDGELGALIKPRFDGWHLDKGEIEKLAKRNRAHIKDILAGVDPTGTKTFQYGMEDVDKPKGEARLRRTLGVAGGVVGGGIAVPMAIYGIIEAARGLSTGGVKGMASGLVKGMKRPVVAPVQAMRAKSVLKRLKKPGAVASERDTSAVFKMFEESPVGSKITSLLKEYPTSTAALLTKLPTKVKGRLHSVVSEELASALAPMGLAGAISGGSAYVQYGKGRRVAKESREKRASIGLGFWDEMNKIGFVDPGRVAFVIGRILQADVYRREQAKKKRVRGYR